MIKATLKLECKRCIEDLDIELEFKGKSFPPIKDTRKKASEQGWSLGKYCYCPSCLKSLPGCCSLCTHWEGNKSMGSYICRLDGEFAIETDYCDNFERRW